MATKIVTAKSPEELETAITLQLAAGKKRVKFYTVKNNLDNVPDYSAMLDSVGESGLVVKMLESDSIETLETAINANVGGDFAAVGFYDVYVDMNNTTKYSALLLSMV